MTKILFTLGLLIWIFGSLQAQVTKNESVLAEGKWFKLATTAQGIHKITYSQLQAWGINSPQQVAVFSNGGHMLPKSNSDFYPDDLHKIPVLHQKDNNNNDCIFFYSTGTVKWNYQKSDALYFHNKNPYARNTYFFITSDQPASPAPAIKESPDKEAEITISTYDHYQLYEEDNINLYQSGIYWYSEKIYNNSSKVINFSFPDAMSGQKGKFILSATATSSSQSEMGVKINNTAAESMVIRSMSLETARPYKKSYEFSATKNLNVEVSFKAASSSGDSWLDFISVSMPSALTLSKEQLLFRSGEAMNYAAVNYHISGGTGDDYVWDLTDPLNPLQLSFINNNGIRFTDHGQSLHEYVVFRPSRDGFPQPVFIGEVANQNLHGLPDYDMIIVSHPDFMTASENLAEYHRISDHFKVLVVDVNQIYNEFGSGQPDPAAIRNLFRFFYQRSKNSDTPLRYVLLMGDGSYDNREWGSGIRFIPTYQSEHLSLFNTITSDDFFVLLDDDEGELNGYLDLGLGRIPCGTLSEALTVVDKTITYASSETLGDWRNMLTFLADDEDGNLFMNQTEQLIEIIRETHPEFYSEKIYFDAYKQVNTSGGERYPDATAAIKRRVEDGTLILNYIGHANPSSLAEEDVLLESDITSWSNKNKFPIFVTATCEFTQFDSDKKSAGEHVMFNNTGGGVALFSTTRKVYASDNFNLSKQFYKYAFSHDENGENRRMGDIMCLAKAELRGYNKRSFSFFGDPAIKMAFPKYNVVSSTINGNPIGDSITIGALEKVTIEGEIHDNFGEIINQFHGQVDITVYDKELNTQTLGNDGSKFEYPVRSNIIYKGMSTVNEGHFSFSFIVPKDIAYNTGSGMIYYYVQNDTIDGNGAFDLFNIGGSGSNPVVDNNPPEMSLYLNNEDFKSNDKVSTSALLMVNLFDESGINTVGTGIGHDVVAIIDHDYTNPIVLNDFYTAEPNTYQRGSIIYPLSNLSQGEHHIMVKAWDILNNSVSEEIYFTVENEFNISQVSNYPNPMRSYTNFNIKHNLPGELFETRIEIFNLRGQKVSELSQTIGSYGTTQNTIHWDIANTRVPIQHEKMLIYRVTLQNKEGFIATGAGKLLIDNY
ncbi:type IX secretion system sortase PorU [Roseimarinus sediminis]|uniref:type IX secretion system sortase PorU n=1 Tax=Roseimarinus sediminis TaxID=1610899 RepID=UPI003D215FB3